MCPVCPGIECGRHAFNLNPANSHSFFQPKVVGDAFKNSSPPPTPSSWSHCVPRHAWPSESSLHVYVSIRCVHVAASGGVVWDVAVVVWGRVMCGVAKPTPTHQQSLPEKPLPAVARTRTHRPHQAGRLCGSISTLLAYILRRVRHAQDVNLFPERVQLREGRA